MTVPRPKVEIFTDGACSGNPGPGGWGALLRMGEVERELWGGEAPTTNNRMEMMAAIQALEALKRPVRAVLTTDSQYLRQGITEWLAGWKRRGWRTADNKPVKNVDLWQRLEAALAPHQVEWHWTRGHAGHAENERVDVLARRGIAEVREAAAAPTPALPHRVATGEGEGGTARDVRASSPACRVGEGRGGGQRPRRGKAGSGEG